MKLNDYIVSVCERNRLSDIEEWFVRSGDDVYYADRHVTSPPEGLDARAACEAGLALLAQWTGEAPEIRNRGVFVSSPLLMVDNEWLTGAPDAQPPHVFVAFAKRQELLIPSRISGQRVNAAECLFGRQINERSQTLSVTKIDPVPEHESLGGWVVQLNFPDALI